MQRALNLNAEHAPLHEGICRATQHVIVVTVSVDLEKIDRVHVVRGTEFVHAQPKIGMTNGCSAVVNLLRVIGARGLRRPPRARQMKASRVQLPLGVEAIENLLVRTAYPSGMIANPLGVLFALIKPLHFGHQWLEAVRPEPVAKLEPERRDA